MSDVAPTIVDLDTVWCGIPVYNNAATILDVARRCRAQLAHVIVVDDGSTDADLRELLKPIDVMVLRHESNAGKGAALLTAFRYAAEHGGRFLIAVDGDGQHFPEDIPRFFSRLEANIILVGNRAEVVGRMPESSRFGRAFSDFWIEVESGRRVRDTQSGFRAYPLAPTLALNATARRYHFEMEVITRAIWAGMNVESIDVRVFYPPADMRISHFHPLRDNLRISLLHARLVLRQLIPLPHRKWDAACHRNNWLTQNANPIGLAFVAGISVVFGVVLGLWGAIPLAYVAIRLHLNKIMALACWLVCLLPIVPMAAMKIGHAMVNDSHRQRLEWIIGSHVIALPGAIIFAWIVYKIARATQAN